MGHPANRVFLNNCGPKRPGRRTAEGGCPHMIHHIDRPV